MIIASLYPCPFDVQDRHEFNASIISGDKIYSYEEGKVTTIKNDGTPKFPERSLMMGFKELQITPDKVDKWVFPTPRVEINIESFHLFFSWFFKAYLGNFDSFQEWFDEHVIFVDHQISHASLAVYGSGFEDCAFLCMDGGGDFGDQRGYVFGEFENNEFNVKFESSGVDTIANFHSFLTDAVGFSGEDNGKTSGLASYGEVIPELKDKLSNLISINKNSGIKFDRKRYRKTGVNLQKIKADAYDRTKIFCKYPSDTNVLRECIEYLPHDIAATGEEILQESVLELLSQLRLESNAKNIVFSGGLFQNVSLNNNLVSSGHFENTYFPSAPSDSGLSLGQALYVGNSSSHNVSPILSAYLGPSYTSSEIVNVLDSHRLVYSICTNIPAAVAEKLSQGKTIGWFQGRAEFGPRSLGARSLVADPRKIESKEKINQLLKKRDWFMPYAPSILEEDILDWVEQEYYSPYMQVAFNIHTDKAEKIPSAVHVDGTSRIHVVRRSENPIYWDLINEFKKLTGIPVLLNTSFNRHGISTISTPRQAIEHLLEGCMDYLAIGEYLVAFEDNRIVSARSMVTEPEEMLLKIGAVERLSIFNDHGSDREMVRFVHRLSKLIGLELTFGNDKKVKYCNNEHNIDDVIQLVIKDIKNSYMCE